MRRCLRPRWLTVLTPAPWPAERGVALPLPSRPWSGWCQRRVCRSGADVGTGSRSPCKSLLNSCPSCCCCYKVVWFCAKILTWENLAKLGYDIFTSRRLSHRLVSVKKKIKKGTFAFWFGSFIICLVLNSDLACNCCLQFLLVIFACFACNFYLQFLLVNFTEI